jgi:hypothetical protein
MEELLKKLSSYNIFNYLLPGIVFVVLSKEALGHSLYVDNVLLGVFYYYFFGLIISRVGSVIIEPLLKKIGMVKHSAYARFVRASKIDEKIETLSESNNMFRTLIALVVCLGIERLTIWIVSIIPIVKDAVIPALLLLVLVLLLLSYKKQSGFITERIIDTENEQESDRR